MNKTLILVVEDDTPVHNLITTTLKTHDYKYISAKNGAGAIMEASTHNPDIVLLDLGLPDIDGVEVIEKIRSWSNMPIIVISARSEDSDKIEALSDETVFCGGTAGPPSSHTAPSVPDAGRKWSPVGCL